MRPPCSGLLSMYAIHIQYAARNGHSGGKDLRTHGESAPASGSAHIRRGGASSIRMYSQKEEERECRKNDQRRPYRDDESLQSPLPRDLRWHEPASPMSYAYRASDASKQRRNVGGKRERCKTVNNSSRMPAPQKGYALDMSLEVLHRLQRGRRETAEAAEPFAERGRGHSASCRRKRLLDFHRAHEDAQPGSRSFGPPMDVDVEGAAAENRNASEKGEKATETGKGRSGSRVKLRNRGT